MAEKKIPLRTCVVTRNVLPKKELIRVVVTKDLIVSVDLKGKANGRGAYLTLDKDVILTAKNKKILDKTLKCTVPDTIYNLLLELALNKEEQ
ncbi:MAG: YlxR family protein [Acholeplasmatales bacterium]|jgi:predicted RNA-binding protein YlxR (DUF448 family)|nr:YlxR family protein [Acholeplasmatales bacterium]